MALAERPWQPLVARLGEFLRIEDWTDGEDDVSFSYVLKSGRDGPFWLLWLSAVGPFGLLLRGVDADAEPVREQVVTAAGASAEDAPVAEVLREAGVRLLSAEEVEATVDFAAPDGRFLVSAFLMLFGETDVPWWHAH